MIQLLCHRGRNIPLAWPSFYTLTEPYIWGYKFWVGKRTYINGTLWQMMKMSFPNRYCFIPHKEYFCFIKNFWGKWEAIFVAKFWDIKCKFRLGNYTKNVPSFPYTSKSECTSQPLGSDPYLLFRNARVYHKFIW